MAADKRVLVVEDNDLNYSLVEFVLGRLGIVVQRALSGDQAVELALAEPPDLIFMDIQLPGVDGLEATRQLRANAVTRDVPIVALTALVMVGDEGRALEAGCDAYLAKPVSPADLRSTAQRLLGLSAKDEQAS